MGIPEEVFQRALYMTAKFKRGGLTAGRGSSRTATVVQLPRRGLSRRVAGSSQGTVDDACATPRTMLEMVGAVHSASRQAITPLIGPRSRSRGPNGARVPAYRGLYLRTKHHSLGFAGVCSTSCAGNRNYLRLLKIVVSPVRVRVSPSGKCLQSAAFCGAFSVSLEDGSLADFDLVAQSTPSRRCLAPLRRASNWVPCERSARCSSCA